MADTSIISGGRPTGNGNSYRPIAGVTFQPGTPVVADPDVDSTVLPAGPTASESSPLPVNPTGIAQEVGVAGNRVSIRFSGPVELATNQWDFITGQSGGLTPNATYFLNSSTQGKLTSVEPVGSGAVVASVGVALSETVLLVQIQFRRINP